jgi:predicted RNA-binding Zn-ribbon protein involved in translation (DUF1610 family)
MDKIVDPKCPGSDPTKKAVPEMFVCPECGGNVEIWTDEKKGTCMSCHKAIFRDQAKLKR